MCKVEWCNNNQNINGTGYCRRHYNEIKKNGFISDERPRGKRNNYITKDDYAILQILNKDGSVKMETIIDIDDIEMLKNYSFRYEKGKYIKTFHNNKTKYLHRIVLNYNGELEIDHINRNKYDNRKTNLRIVDRKTNANNLNKRYTNGITKRNNLSKPYMLRVNKKYIGYFKTIDEAIMVRDNILNNI